MQSDTSKKILFMGAPKISVLVLEDLIQSGVKISGVITRPDKPKGRGLKVNESDLKIFAKRHDLKIFQPKTKIELTEILEHEKPDLCIVAAFGMIIPKEALEIPKFGMINFHPSLLPKWRGPAPISMPIMCGDKKTGVTIIEVSEGMDEGDILDQKTIPLNGTETTDSLEEKLAKIGAEMIYKLLPKIFDGTITKTPQDSKKATYSKMVKKEDGQLFFKKYHAENIERAGRALNPWPGLYSYWQDKKINFYEIKIIAGNNLKPGRVKIINEDLLIGTKNGIISPKYIKIEGKNKIAATDFIRGYPKFLDTILD